MSSGVRHVWEMTGGRKWEICFARSRQILRRRYVLEIIEKGGSMLIYVP
jgi:hypothetical protein